MFWGLLSEHTNAYDQPLLELNHFGVELGPHTFLQWVGVLFHTYSCIYPTPHKSLWGLVATHNNVYCPPPCGDYMGVVIYTHLCIWLHIGSLQMENAITVYCIPLDIMFGF